MPSLVLATANASLFAQIVAIVVGGIALVRAMNIQSNKLILRDALSVEMLVNVIQFVVYVFMVSRVSVAQWGTLRYYDWFITTPLMLFTMAVYMQYKAKQTDSIRIWNALRTTDVLLIGGANLGMLIFGYLGETGRIDKVTATLIGFIFFAIAFRLLYVKYAAYSSHGKYLYAYMLSLWTLYGIAYMLPSTLKNASFNVLDIFAKNFFSLFLSYQLIQNTRAAPANLDSPARIPSNTRSETE